MIKVIIQYFTTLIVAYFTAQFFYSMDMQVMKWIALYVFIVTVIFYPLCAIAKRADERTYEDTEASD